MHHLPYRLNANIVSEFLWNAWFNIRWYNFFYKFWQNCNLMEENLRNSETHTSLQSFQFRSFEEHVPCYQYDMFL
jgi:hypothetical protein